MDRLSFNDVTEPLVLSLILFFSLLVLLISALMIFTEMQVAFRFYRSLFSKEGYLSWTLPVSGPQHLWAKIISGYILMAADLIIIAAGILLLVTGNNVTTAYSMVSDDLTNELELSIGTFALILFVICLVSGICSVVMIYFLLQSASFSQAIGCWVQLRHISSHQPSCRSSAVILMFLFGCFPGYMTYTLQGSAMADYLFRLIAVSLVLMLITTIAQYIATHYIMKKKINLL